MRESRDDTVGREVDYPGVAVLTAGLTALVLALVEGNHWGWGSTGSSPCSPAPRVLAAFVPVEQRVEAPMVQFGLFAIRNFVGAIVVALIVTFAMLGVVLLPRPLHAGHPRLLAARGRASGSCRDPDDRRDRADRRPAHRPLRAALAIAAGLAIVAAAVLADHVDVHDLRPLPSFMLMGIGMALVISPMSTAAMNAVADEKAGIAMWSSWARATWVSST